MANIESTKSLYKRLFRSQRKFYYLLTKEGEWTASEKESFSHWQLLLTVQYHLYPDIANAAYRSLFDRPF